MQLLQPIKDEYGDGLSWADLIVLTGNVALEQAGKEKGISIKFTGGRTDAPSTDPPYPDYLEGRLNGGDADDTNNVMKDVAAVWGVTNRQMVALIGGGHTLGRMHYDRSGFVDGSWTTTPFTLNNEFFVNLFDLEWNEIGQSDLNNLEYQAVNINSDVLYMLKTDMYLRYDGEFRAVAEEYYQDESLFLNEFIAAWETLMNADLFWIDEAAVSDDDTSNQSSNDDNHDLSYDSAVTISVIFGVFGGILLAVVGVFVYKKKFGKKSDMDENLIRLSAK